MLVDCFLHLLVRLACCRLVLYHKCFGYFACALINDGDDGAVGDVVVGEKMGFQLSGSDLMALRIVNVLPPKYV